MRAGDVLADLGRPVVVHTNLVRALGSWPAAAMLAQLLYWTGREAGEDGWIHKVEAEWDEELAFTPKRLKGARTLLVDLGIIEHTRRGLPALPCYRVKMEGLEQWWIANLSGGKPPNQSGPLGPDRVGPLGPDTTGPLGPDIPLSLDDDRDDLHREPPKPPAVVEEPDSKISDVRQVFDAWVAAKGTRAVLDDKRRRLIAARLKEFPLEDLIDAVQGWRHSAHHRGENSSHTVYNDLALLLRDADHVERFRDLQRGEGAVSSPSVAVPNHAHYRTAQTLANRRQHRKELGA